MNQTNNPKAKAPAQATITPASSDFLDVLFYAVPRFSDILRRLSDIKNSQASKPLKMSPSTGLWLTLALVGLIVSANSYFVGFQHWLPSAQGQITTAIPLGRSDVLFRPMALFPPVLLWLSKVVNFATGLIGLILPADLQAAAWTPATRPTIWSNATLALAWWISAGFSILISSTQGLFTRTTTLSKQREYATRLNAIAKIQLNSQAISAARHEVNKANRWGQGAVWGMTLIAVAGWGWELFVADGALDGSSFDSKAYWIYTLSSTFLAELCWFISEKSGKEL